MDADCDLECTCDAGPHATCPVCRARKIDLPAKPAPRRKRKWETQSAEDRIAEIKAGYRS